MPKPLWTVFVVLVFAYSVYVCLLIDRNRYSDRVVFAMVLLTFIPLFGALALHLYLLADQRSRTR
jgi:hypothetical protein